MAFMQGCPLRCRFCHNPDTWEPDGAHQYDMTAAELVQEVLRYRSFIKAGGFTATGGEPLLQAAFLAEVCEGLQAEGIHTAIDTSGCVPVSPVTDRLLDHVDLVLLDVKSADERQYDELVRGKGRERSVNDAFLRHLQERGIDVWIRHVLVPGWTDDDALLSSLHDYISQFSVVKHVEILPYHTLGRFKYEKLGLPYPLEGVEPPSKERVAQVCAMFSDLQR